MKVNCRAALLLLCLVLPLSAFGNFSQALAYYQKGEYEKAFEMFVRMAEMGYFPAQYNLGVMYYLGQFVEADPVKGYAWAKLAEGHLAHIDDAIAAMYGSFTDEGKVHADEEAARLAAQYGPEALAQTLLPSPLHDDKCPPVQVPLSKVHPRYPSKALFAGMMGTVVVVFDVDRMGRTRNPVVLAGPAEFHQSALQAVTEFRYEPGRPAQGVMNAVTYMISDRPDNAIDPSVQKQIDEFRRQAEAGSPVEKYQYAVSVSHLDQLRPEYYVLNEYLVDAASQGLPHAQYLIGRNLLKGQGCEVDRSKALEWLRRSAQMDYAHAQYLLAEETASNPETLPSALVWLENAADSKHFPSMLRLSWFLATTTNGERSDPRRALDLAMEVEKTYVDKITAWDTLAAAYAANGDFRNAVKYQKKAIKRARDLEWEIPELGAHLASYENGEPWREGD